MFSQWEGTFFVREESALRFRKLPGFGAASLEASEKLLVSEAASLGTSKKLPGFGAENPDAR
ncbi:hypothetical protein CE91St46_16770 [Eubacteriales bacterium]|nr:hypothetical protein CE91St46_16770 [Eubacteriales bacterium]GKH63288.1 hypothetical protein CE91St47_17570 [Eubacteriales bacterium]